MRYTTIEEINKHREHFVDIALTTCHGYPCHFNYTKLNEALANDNSPLYIYFKNTDFPQNKECIYKAYIASDECGVLQVWEFNVYSQSINIPICEFEHIFNMSDAFIFSDEESCINFVNEYIKYSNEVLKYNENKVSEIDTKISALNIKRDKLLKKIENIKKHNNKYINE